MSAAARTWLPRLARLYLAGFALWLALRFAFGDGFWWLYVLNVSTDYLMELVPVALVLALPFRRARWVLGLASLGVVVAMVGNVRLPAASARAESPSLKVMTFNVSDAVESPEPMLAAIRRSDADVVCIQELSQVKAAAIDNEMADAYPYRLLSPKKGRVDGMGIISRFPIRQVDSGLDEHQWIGDPLLVQLDWGGTRISVLAAHAMHTLAGPQRLGGLNTIRLQDARAVVKLARADDGPIILCADFNSTPHNTPYALLTSTLTDSWLEAGAGPGYSWNVLPVALGAFRIDYVLHSRQLRAIDASVEQWDGASDHRPVSARLMLTRDASP